MSSRHIRRAQQDLQLQDASDSEPDEPLPTRGAANAFGLLLESDGEASSGDELQDESPLQSGAVEAPPAPGSVEIGPGACSEPDSKPACRRRGGKKAQRSKPSNERHEPADNDDDDDELLAAAAAESAAAAAAAALEAASTDSTDDFDPWRLNAADLEASGELSRKFGRSTLKMLAAAERAERGGARAPHGAGRGGSRKPGGASLLVKPRDTWPPWGRRAEHGA